LAEENVRALAEENARALAEAAEANARALAEANDRARALAEENERVKALKDGFYCATIAHQVWQFHVAEFSPTDLDATIRRQAPHHFYRATCEAAKGDELYPAYKESGRSEYDPAGSSTWHNDDDRDSQTEIARRKRLREVVIDGSARGVAEVAHFWFHTLSNGAHFYSPLAEAAVGAVNNVDDDTSLSPQKKKKLKRLVLVHGQYENKKGNGDKSLERV
jgi:hypothetical protein